MYKRQIKDWSNDDGSRYMVLFYKTNKFEGKLSASNEGEVYWTEIEDMKKADLADGMYRPPKVRPKNLTIGGRYFYG